MKKLIFVLAVLIGVVVVQAAEIRVAIKDDVLTELAAPVNAGGMQFPSTLMIRVVFYPDVKPEDAIAKAIYTAVLEQVNERLRADAIAVAVASAPTKSEDEIKDKDAPKDEEKP